LIRLLPVQLLYRLIVIAAAAVAAAAVAGSVPVGRGGVVERIESPDIHTRSG
jgi:hypothetical protein